MTDERRLRLMVRLARFEQKEGKEDLRISRYYRSDYVGAALLKNFFLATIAYLLLLALIVIANLELLLDNFSQWNVQPLIAAAVLGYLFVLGIYSVLTYTLARLRYARAEKSVQEYAEKLELLEKMYSREEAGNTRRRGAAGRRKA
jgi:phosphatidylglycerophosphate synthase